MHYHTKIDIMNENTYINWSHRSDQAIEKALGAYIKEMRLRQNKSQSEVAKQANISRSTLSLMERGEAGTISTLIKILRVLNQLQTLETFEIRKQVSPLAMAKAEQKKRQRVSKTVNQKNKSSW
jgi:transcriptional regulator with XRE-family HTH domain